MVLKLTVLKEFYKVVLIVGIAVTYRWDIRNFVGGLITANFCGHVREIFLPHGGVIFPA
jgi:hypothetical protein